MVEREVVEREVAEREGAAGEAGSGRIPEPRPHRLEQPLACWHESRQSARTDRMVALDELGGFIETDRPLEAGTAVFLELHLGHASNAARAEIDAVVAEVHADVNGTPGFGVRFLDLDDAVGVWIRRHLGLEPSSHARTADIPTRQLAEQAKLLGQVPEGFDIPDSLEDGPPPGSLPDAPATLGYGDGEASVEDRVDASGEDAPGEVDPGASIALPAPAAPEPLDALDADDGDEEPTLNQPPLAGLLSGGASAEATLEAPARSAPTPISGVSSEEPGGGRGEIASAEPSGLDGLDLFGDDDEPTEHSAIPAGLPASPAAAPPAVEVDPSFDPAPPVVVAPAVGAEHAPEVAAAVVVDFEPEEALPSVGGVGTPLAQLLGAGGPSEGSGPAAAGPGPGPSGPPAPVPAPAAPVPAPAALAPPSFALEAAITPAGGSPEPPQEAARAAPLPAGLVAEDDDDEAEAPTLPSLPSPGVLGHAARGELTPAPVVEMDAPRASRESLGDELFGDLSDPEIAAAPLPASGMGIAEPGIALEPGPPAADENASAPAPGPAGAAAGLPAPPRAGALPPQPPPSSAEGPEEAPVGTAPTDDDAGFDLNFESDPGTGGEGSFAQPLPDTGSAQVAEAFDAFFGPGAVSPVPEETDLGGAEGPRDGPPTLLGVAVEADAGPRPVALRGHGAATSDGLSLDISWDDGPTDPSARSPQDDDEEPLDLDVQVTDEEPTLPSAWTDTHDRTRPWTPAPGPGAAAPPEPPPPPRRQPLSLEPLHPPPPRGGAAPSSQGPTGAREVEETRPYTPAPGAPSTPSLNPFLRPPERPPAAGAAPLPAAPVRAAPPAVIQETQPFGIDMRDVQEELRRTRQTADLGAGVGGMSTPPLGTPRPHAPPPPAPALAAPASAPPPRQTLQFSAEAVKAELAQQQLAAAAGAPRPSPQPAAGWGAAGPGLPQSRIPTEPQFPAVSVPAAGPPGPGDPFAAPPSTDPFAAVRVTDPFAQAAAPSAERFDPGPDPFAAEDAARGPTPAPPAPGPAPAAGSASRTPTLQQFRAVGVGDPPEEVVEVSSTSQLVRVATDAQGRVTHIAERVNPSVGGALQTMTPLSVPASLELQVPDASGSASQILLRPGDFVEPSQELNPFTDAADWSVQEARAGDEGGEELPVVVGSAPPPAGGSPAEPWVAFEPPKKHES